MRIQILLLYFLMITGIILCGHAVAFCQTKTQVKSENPKMISSVPKNLAIRDSTAEEKQLAEEKAKRMAEEEKRFGEEMARRLAEAFKNAGVDDGSNELANALASALAEGGQSSMAVATAILYAITEARVEQSSKENTKSQKDKFILNDRQLTNMIQRVTTEKDSSLSISKYLKVKLYELKKITTASKQD